MNICTLRQRLLHKVLFKYVYNFVFQWRMTLKVFRRAVVRAVLRTQTTEKQRIAVSTLTTMILLFLSTVTF